MGRARAQARARLGFRICETVKLCCDAEPNLTQVPIPFLPHGIILRTLDPICIYTYTNRLVEEARYKAYTFLYILYIRVYAYYSEEVDRLAAGEY